MALPTQLNPTEQDALVKQIGLALLRVAPQRWASIVVEYRATGRYMETVGQVTVQDKDGAEDLPVSPDITMLFSRLRAGMYREGRGTWFNARYQLDQPSAYNLEYDRDEPKWIQPPPPPAFADDLRIFPRDEENVPEWLARRLAALKPPFRVARIFDGKGPNGRPLVNRPQVDDTEREALLRFLDEAPLALPHRGLDTDHLDDEGRQSVPVAFHTDGSWIWPAAVNYYLRAHGVAPEPELVDHIRRTEFTLPDVEEHVRANAAAFLNRGRPPRPVQVNGAAPVEAEVPRLPDPRAVQPKVAAGAPAALPDTSDVANAFVAAGERGAVAAPKEEMGPFGTTFDAFSPAPVNLENPPPWSRTPADAESPTSAEAEQADKPESPWAPKGEDAAETPRNGHSHAPEQAPWERADEPEDTAKGMRPVAEKSPLEDTAPWHPEVDETVPTPPVVAESDTPWAAQPAAPAPWQQAEQPAQAWQPEAAEAPEQPSAPAQTDTPWQPAPEQQANPTWQNNAEAREPWQAEQQPVSANSWQPAEQAKEQPEPAAPWQPEQAVAPWQRAPEADKTPAWQPEPAAQEAEEAQVEATAPWQPETQADAPWQQDRPAEAGAHQQSESTPAWQPEPVDAPAQANPSWQPEQPADAKQAPWQPAGHADQPTAHWKPDLEDDTAERAPWQQAPEVPEQPSAPWQPEAAQEPDVPAAPWQPVAQEPAWQPNAPEAVTPTWEPAEQKPAEPWTEQPAAPAWQPEQNAQQVEPTAGWQPEQPSTPWQQERQVDTADQPVANREQDIQPPARWQEAEAPSEAPWQPAVPEAEPARGQDAPWQPEQAEAARQQDTPWQPAEQAPPAVETTQPWQPEQSTWQDTPEADIAHGQGARQAGWQQDQNVPETPWQQEPTWQPEQNGSSRQQANEASAGWQGEQAPSQAASDPVVVEPVRAEQPLVAVEPAQQEFAPPRESATKDMRTPPAAALPSQGPAAEVVARLRSRLTDLGVSPSRYRMGSPSEAAWTMEQTGEGWRVGWFDERYVAPAVFEDVADASAFLLGKILLDNAATSTPAPPQDPGPSTVQASLAELEAARPSDLFTPPRRPEQPATVAAPAPVFDDDDDDFTPRRAQPRQLQRKPEPAVRRPEPAALRAEPVPHRPEPLPTRPEPGGHRPEPVTNRTEPTGRKPQDWPIQPRPGEPPLTLFRGKQLMELPPGTEIDRYGEPMGNLTYAAGTPFERRSLVPEWVNRPYRAYRVVKPTEALTGVAIPWFDQPGGGVAYLLKRSIGELLDHGNLVEVDDRDAPTLP
ncbi:TNT domain-containing protein [Actinokineospora globicatena]|uniref:TNT domain-containing protein n=1 Tax=Actinokineospora globicatena TaxID=103729 RepID=UPI002556F65D|nr:glycohydrolase toxin TNT-related protein [Actinokineospora globicatena]